MKLHEKTDEVVRWVKAYLSTAHARGVKDMLTCAPYLPQEIQRALQQLMASSEIEALVPVGVACHPSSQCLLHPDTHFRLVRETDTAYRWQVRIAEKVEAASDWSRNCFVTKINERYSDDFPWLGVKWPASA